MTLKHFGCLLLKYFAKTSLDFLAKAQRRKVLIENSLRRCAFARNFAFVLISTFLLLSCNEDTKLVQSTPFSVAPNPCRGVITIFLLPGVSASSIVYEVFDRDGSSILRSTYQGVPPPPVAVQLKKQGIYYVEVTLDGESFTEEILNLE